MTIVCTNCNRELEPSSYRDQSCPHCGVLVQHSSVRECPRCRTMPQRRKIHDVVLHECSSCNGAFVDHATLVRMLEDPRHGRIEPLLRDLSPREHHASASTASNCPVCSALMQRRMTAGGSGVIVDVCRAHGTWFAANGLRAVLVFLERASRERAELDRADASHRKAQEEHLRRTHGEGELQLRLPVDVLFDSILKAIEKADK